MRSDLVTRPLVAVDGGSDRQRSPVLAVILVAAFMDLLDAGIVFLALLHIQHDLQAGPFGVGGMETPRTSMPACSRTWPQPRHKAARCGGSQRRHGEAGDQPDRAGAQQDAQRDLPRHRHVQQVTVYFDTPCLLDALGYAGKEIAQPALELPGLIRDLDAWLACFGHTVTELQGVLGGIANGLRNPRRRAALTLSRVEEHFVREGLGPSDIEVFQNTVERDLRTLGINVCPTPRYEEHLGVDELALEDLLQAEVGYQNQYARRHDLDTLTAIWRLRHGRRGHRSTQGRTDQ
jgi:hypothetical protein